jgi:hypothetical protein
MRLTTGTQKEDAMKQDAPAILTPVFHKATADSSDDSLETLKAFCRLLDQSKKASYLLTQTNEYRHIVPPRVLARVQEDYQRRKEETDKSLEREIESYIKAYQKHLAEQEELGKSSLDLTDQLKELKFRYVLGEYSDQDIEEQCRDLRRQLSENMTRRCLLEDVLDTYAYLGVDPLHFRTDAMETTEDPPCVPQNPEENLPSYDNHSSASPGHDEAISSLAREAAEDFRCSLSPDPLPSNEAAGNGYETKGVLPCGEGYFLTAMEGSLRGERFPLISGAIMLGSSPGNDIRLQDAGVAGSHARILYRDKRYYLENMEALGRTWVNGIQSTLSELHDGDVIRLGEVTMRVAFSRSRK